MSVAKRPRTPTGPPDANEASVAKRPRMPESSPDSSEPSNQASVAKRSRNLEGPPNANETSVAKRPRTLTGPLDPRSVSYNAVVLGVMIRGVYRRDGWLAALAMVCHLGQVSRLTRVLAWNAYRSILHDKPGSDIGRFVLERRLHDREAESAFLVMARAFHGNDRPATVAELVRKLPSLMRAPVFVRVVADYGGELDDETLWNYTKAALDPLTELEPTTQIEAVDALLGLTDSAERPARMVQRFLVEETLRNEFAWLDPKSRMWALAADLGHVVRMAVAARRVLEALLTVAPTYTASTVAEMAAAFAVFGLLAFSPAEAVRMLEMATEAGGRALPMALCPPRAQLCAEAFGHERPELFFAQYARIFPADGPLIWRHAIADSRWKTLAEALVTARVRSGTHASLQKIFASNQHGFLKLGRLKELRTLMEENHTHRPRPIKGLGLGFKL